MVEQNKRKSYPTDLTDAEWQQIEPHLPKPKSPRGRKRLHSFREILNAILYVLRSSCACRMPTHHQPPGRPSLITSVSDDKTAHGHASITPYGRSSVPHRTETRNRVPPFWTASRSKRRKKGPRGYDAGKKVNGRKRHLLVDTLGLILMVVVHAASVPDRDGAKLVLERVKGSAPSLRLIWADGACAGQLVDWVKTACGQVLEIIKRTDDVTGFQVLPRRWVVERPFAWVGKYRCLSRDYEGLAESGEGWIYGAMVHVMVRRLARLQAASP